MNSLKYIRAQDHLLDADDTSSCGCDRFVSLITKPFSSKPAPSDCNSKQNRRPPSEGAQMAGAAALARIEHQQRPKVHTSQDAIRIQGETGSCTYPPGDGCLMGVVMQTDTLLFLSSQAKHEDHLQGDEKLIEC